MRFGTHIDHADPAGSARSLEAEGFDYVHTGEHLVFHDRTGPSGMIALAAAAAVTDRIRLLSLIVILPLYPTILLAKMAATLDLVSRGRYELGVGIGGDYPKEFGILGIPMRQRGARADEALEVLRRGWAEEALTFHGRFHSVDGLRFDPRPIQRPHLPIWVAGRREAAMRRAGKYGDHWVPYLCTPELLADGMRVVGDAADEAGRARSDVAGAVLTYFSVYEDRATARRTATEFMTNSYRRDFSDLVDRYVIHGTVEDARARLREFYDAGARTILSVLAAPAEDRAMMRHLLTTEVLPEFRVQAAG